MRSVDLPRAIRVVERGLVELAPLLTARHRLDDAAAAFAALADRRGLKVVIEPAV